MPTLDTTRDAFETSGNSPTLRPRTATVTLTSERTAVVSYEISGNPASKDLVVVLGGISAGRQVADTAPESPGWWGRFVGPNRAIDTERHAVLSFDYLGTGDATISPSLPDLPVSTYDQADALAQILDHVGATTIRCLVGASYGGMVGLAFAERYPRRVDRLAILSAAHRAHSMATGWRKLQREVVSLGVEAGNVRRGLVLARGLAMTTYRSAREFDRRFGDDGSAAASTAAVGGYLEARGTTFADTFDPAAFLRLSASIDGHRVDPARITTPTHLFSVDSDTLVPTWLMEQLRDNLGGPTHWHPVSSEFGHDAFLKETRSVRALLQAAIEDVPANSTVTSAVRAGVATDSAHGAVMPPLYLSSNYTFADFGVKRTHDYTRTSNPTRDLLAQTLTELEAGAGTVVTSSGMSAVALVVQLLERDDEVLVTNDCYGGTHRLIDTLARRGRFGARFVDLADEHLLQRITEERPRMVWIETPSNPLLRITDIARVARQAHAIGALVVVDNTLLSPALQQPLTLGADLVVHSTTKFLNGHSDIVGGAVVAADRTLAQELAWWANCLGLTGAPFDTYLTLRGVRTLHARVRAHCESTSAVVDVLRRHPAVRVLHFPGLAGHPGHAIAATQQSGWGSLVSFELRGGAPAVAELVRATHLFTLAESLGGVESLVAHPATMTHAAMPATARAAAGIEDSLVRLSVGIEDPDDLGRDLRAALDAAAYGGAR